MSDGDSIENQNPIGASPTEKRQIQKRSINPLALILGLSALMFAAFVVFSMIFFLKRGSDWDNKRHDAILTKQESYIGVIELKGVILESKRILKYLRIADDDQDIRAVVLRLDSPGGAVAPSQEIYEAVKHFKKPLVVSMGSIAASGAFYVAMGAHKIFANSGTLTGSIGVIMEMANLKNLYKWAKIERFAIKTGKFKDSGAEYRDMTEEDRAYFQGLVNDSLKQFKGAVKLGRNLSDKEIDAIADGRVFTGSQAKELNLIDELGTMDDAVAWVTKKAGIKDKPKLVYPQKKSASLLEALLAPQKGDDDWDDDDDEKSFIDQLSAKVIDRILPSERALPTGLLWIWNAGH